MREQINLKVDLEYQTLSIRITSLSHSYQASSDCNPPQHACQVLNLESGNFFNSFSQVSDLSSRCRIYRIYSCNTCSNS